MPAGSLYMYSRVDTRFAKMFCKEIKDVISVSIRVLVLVNSGFLVFLLVGDCYFRTVAVVVASINSFQYLPGIASLKVNGGDGRVVRWYWVNFQCRGVLLIWIRERQGPTALAVGAGGGCLGVFFSRLSFLFPFFLSLEDGPI